MCPATSRTTTGWPLTPKRLSPLTNPTDSIRLISPAAAAATVNHNQLSSSLKFQTTARRGRSLLLTIFYAWLIMNADVSYKRRVVHSLRLLSRALNRQQQPLNDIQGILTGRNRNGAGMSTIEAIALIQAINSGNNRQPYAPTDGGAGSPYVGGADLTRIGQGSALSRARQFVQETTGRQQIGNRQLPVPVPVPVPAPFPNAVVAAFVAALVAAIAAGFPPLIAVAKAVVAALVALIIIILQNPLKTKGSPLVKKIIIKKTVLPFVFPITVKKKEKEIIYKYIKPKHHEHKEHEEHDHHEEQHYEKRHKKYKYKKMDLPTIDQPELTNDDGGVAAAAAAAAAATATATADAAAAAAIPAEEQPPQIPTNAFTKTSHLKSIESLVDEQDQLQTILDSVITNGAPKTTI